MLLPLSRSRLCVVVAGVAFGLACTGRLAVAQPAQAASGTVKTAAPAPGTLRTITWEQLVPPDWDPMKDFKGQDMSALSDADPRTLQMMKKLREAWDLAPTNPALVGQPVRLPGFVVPLEDSKDGMKEFLLVPYFGACIHTPPPPANQIVLVRPLKPAKGVRSMDTVWISGVLSTTRTDSHMGMSAYRIDAQAVEPYVERAR